MSTRRHDNRHHLRGPARGTARRARRSSPAPARHNCGGRCVVNAHVRRRPHRHASRPIARRWQPEHAAAARLRARRRPDRADLSSRTGCNIRMRRVGPRGSGQFERISWDEALDEVAREMRRVRDGYGNAAILDASRTGTQSMLHGRVAAPALPPHVRRLHRSVVEHVGRGRGVRGAHHLRRQGRLQDAPDASRPTTSIRS